jgi:cyclophilin family peptidyl-prolyl cis-trans isomerase
VVQRAVAEGMAKRSIADATVPRWRASGEWQRRAAAVELQAIGPAREALPRAEGWTHDGDMRVRAVAAGEIARLVDSAATRARARHALAVQLQDEDVGVRAAALSGLAAGATPDELYRAMVAYARGSGDRELDARLAFWQLADSALRSRTPLPDSVTAVLAAIPRPADPLERRAASSIARFASWRDDTSPARPLGWYEDRLRETLGRRLVADVETDRGTIALELFGSDAPLTVYNFTRLAREGYFDGVRFHRVVPNFVAQGGDPRGDGNGGPGYAIRDEINPRRYRRGTLGMALSGPHTGGSQFFITHSPQPHLDGGYTVFGQLASGGDVLDRIVQGDRIVRITIR